MCQSHYPGPLLQIGKLRPESLAACSSEYSVECWGEGSLTQASAAPSLLDGISVYGVIPSPSPLFQIGELRQK